MRNLTRKKIGGIIFAVLMFVAAVLTIIDTPLNWWRWISSDETVSTPFFANQPETPSQSATATAKPPVTATPVRTAKAMLDTALSVPLSSDRSKALRIVATTGVAEWDYETAITAGRSTPIPSERTETLTFVARCAGQDGLFETADEAATYIPSSTVRSSVKIEILEMHHRQVTLGISPIPGRAGWIRCR